MFSLALSLGIYSYLIFLLGAVGFLNRNAIFFVTSACIFYCVFLCRKKILSLKKTKKIKSKNVKIIAIITSIAFINLIGALGPELAFDALWYHLTIPKIWLQNEQITYIPGGLFYYSAMPKLVDIMYISAIALQGQTFAKLIHYSFGILISITLYKASRKYLTQKEALLTVLVFYSNLVVAWESITAYIDLGRTFFELLAFLYIIEYSKDFSTKNVVKSSIMLGLALSTKIISLSTLPVIFIVMHFLHYKKNKSYFLFFKNIFVYTIVCLVIPLPWFLFSFANTGSPIFPFFTDSYQIASPLTLPSPQMLIDRILFSPDPISPIYVTVAPVIALLFKKLNIAGKAMCIYSLFAVTLWLLIPHTGGARFLMPYLPILSIVTVITLKKVNNSMIKKMIYISIIFLSLTTIMYRAVANAKYVPVVLGIETQQNFLTKNLNYNYGDFYDTDGYFKKTITDEDKVLISEIHNLYYVEFPIHHTSFSVPDDTYNYFLTKSGNIPPERYKDWTKVYENSHTHVVLYKKP